MPPAPSPTEPQAPVRNTFPFNVKPNILDRDRILVPAGWDSWGKIGVLRDGFDAKLWNEAWERDLEPEGSSNEPGAKKLYAALVPDQGSKVRFADVRLDIMLKGRVGCTTPAIQQSSPRATVPLSSLRREREKVRQGSAWGFQEPWRAGGRHRRSARKQLVQSAQRREGSVRDGVWHGPYLSCR